jgi:hypothetical protein
MTDIRQQLEDAWTSAETQSAEQPTETVATSESNETVTAEPVDVINAPNSYTKEAKDWFNTLPHENQKYLAEREKQFEQGLSRARNQYAWVDKAYNDRKDNLLKQGFNNTQEYFNTLVSIADALEKNPADTIAQLQSIYGINGSNDNALQRQLLDLQQTVANQQNYLREQENKRVKNEYDAFVNAKDENGNVKHGYFEEVKDDMLALLQSGMAKNFEDAYNQAIWRVEDVRNKIIEEQAKANLAKATATVQKAKTAAFEPTSKGDATPKKRTLREELEHNMAIYGEE